MLYCELNLQERNETLTYLGVDIDSVQLSDPSADDNKVYLIETLNIVTISVRPSTRKEQLYLLYDALVLRNSYLFIAPHPVPLPIWKRLLRPIIITCTIGEEYIRFFDIDTWTKFKEEKAQAVIEV